MIDLVHKEMIKLYAGDPKRIQHFCKVYEYAKMIGTGEQIQLNDMQIVELAALTHDIGIHKSEEKYGSSSGKYQEIEGPEIAKELLERVGISKDVNDRVQYLIAHHHTYENIKDIDYQILVEADFIVNAYEDEFDENSLKEVYKNIFKTTTGKELFKTMYKIEE